MTTSIGKYLQATEVAAPKRKTKIFDIYGDKGIRIGVVQWFGSWRQYAFFPDANMVFEKQCLRDLAAFCEHLMYERKRLSGLTQPGLPKL